MKMKLVILMLVLFSLVSTAAATEPVTPSYKQINVYSTDTVDYQISYTGLTEPMYVNFTVLYAGVETDEIVGSIAGNAWGSKGSALYAQKVSESFDGTEYTVVWNFSLKDGASDADDDSQVGKVYKVNYQFTFPDYGTQTGETSIDVVHTYVEAIPEFPTIALPVAAILGLAFYFQRRKEE
jgi:hypothetical protein